MVHLPPIKTESIEPKSPQEPSIERGVRTDIFTSKEDIRNVKIEKLQDGLKQLKKQIKELKKQIKKVNSGKPRTIIQETDKSKKQQSLNVKRIKLDIKQQKLKDKIKNEKEKIKIGRLKAKVKEDKRKKEVMRKAMAVRKFVKKRV